MGRLDGEVAVVTGGASGIGREISKLYASEGASICCFDINKAGLEETVKSIEEAGGKAIYVDMDLSDSSQVAAGMKKCADTFGKISILVNCAAMINYKKIEETSDEEFKRMLDVNICGYFYCLREGYPYLKQTGNSKVIQFSSSTAISGSGFANMAYCASKSAVFGLVKQSAGAWAKEGIRVNGISPGLTATPITDAGDGKVKDKEAHEKAIPMGRIADPIDMARVALFLASEDSGYMTGQVLHVNGGKYMYNV